MEAKVANRSLSCNKQMRNSKVMKHQNNPFHNYYHHQQVELEKMMMMHGNGNGNGNGCVFLNPTIPFPLSSSLSLPPITTTYHKNTTQPPLLPLPISKPIFHSLPPHIIPSHNSHSPPPPPPSKRKQPYKTKPKNLNPNPKPKLLATKQPNNKDVFIFSMSPPPSSLPLPKFSLRQPKLSCTVQAAADQVSGDGATDNLRRMLKLQ